jgi:PAS domain S-box-containing protein
LNLNESNIGKFNLFSTIFLLLIFATLIIYSSITSKEKSFNNLKNEFQEKFIKNKKNKIKDNVLTVNSLVLSNLENKNLTINEKQELSKKLFRKLNKENINEYFFVFSLNKTKDGEYIEKVVVHPNVPEGKLLDINRKDLDGNMFVRDFQKRLLENGSTFLKYSFLHPRTKEEKYKISFFVLNKDWNWIIGSGFYLNDINDELKHIETTLKDDIYNELKTNLFITFIFLLILIYLVILINRITNKTIDNFKIQIKDHESKILASEDYLKQYSSIIEKSSMVSKTDLEGRITYVSDSFVDITGFTKNELLNNTHSLLRHYSVSDEFFAKMWNTIKSKKTFRALIKNFTKDKKIIYLDTTISPIFDKEGDIIEFIAYRFDITKEVELQSTLIKQNYKLSESKNILNEAQRIAHVGNWENNLELDKLTFSKEANSIYGLNVDENGISFDEFKKIFDKDELKYIDDAFEQSILEHKKFFVEHKIKKADGTITYVEVISEHVYNNKDQVIKSVGIVHDITKRKLSEIELKQKDLMLLQQSKLAAMGEMISNIAHQWRQPLSAISSASTGARVQKEIGVFDDDDFNKTMTSINNSAQYLSHTIDDFRNFFKSDTKKEYINIKTILLKTIALIEIQFKEKEIKDNTRN